MGVYRIVERIDRKMIFLVLVSTVHFTTACLQGVPDFIITDNPISTPTGIQGIVTSSSFSCDGRVTGWTACFANDPTMVHYTMQFLVWRPGNNGCYELLGTNVLSTTAPNSNAQFDVFDTYCISVQVPRDEQIAFRPNDHIGFFIAIIGQPPANTGGLLLDTNMLGAIVLGSGPCFGVFTQSLGPLVGILGSPLLSALVDDIAEGGAESSPDEDNARDSSASISVTYNTSSATSSEFIPPVSMVHAPPHHTQSPVPIPTSHTQMLAQISTTYTQSPSHTSTTPTTQSVLSLGYTVQVNDHTVTLTETIPKLPWLSSSTSMCTLKPSTSVISTGKVGETRSNDALEPATKYVLVAVGVVLTIASTVLTIVAILCFRKCKNRKHTSKSNRGQTRVASEFIYNTTYERYMGRAGLVTNLRRESTEYHSHWSLTHCDDSDSICYSYPSPEMVEMDNIYNTPGHNRTGNSSSADNSQTHTRRLPCGAKEGCARNVVIPNPFQSNRKDGSPKVIIHTTRQISSKGNTHSQRGKYDRGCACQYDNPIFRKRQEESDGSAASVYYSEPTKQEGPSSIFLSNNEAYTSRNPMPFLLSENEAYKSPNAGGVSGENVCGATTDSVYYTRPTVISGEGNDGLEVSSNLAYGTSHTSIEHL